MRRTQITARTFGLLIGIAACITLLSLAPPDGMTAKAWRVVAIGALMVAWWMTEAVPIAVTALLPIVLFPALGISDIATSTAPYASPVIFLFLGGFVIGKAWQHCGLHRRIALATICVVGNAPANLVAGFMLATAFISMWVSNTATVLLIYPMALSVIERKQEPTPAGNAFAVALLLGIAYAANIGGMATLIGSPPNALLAGFASETLGRTVGFAQWMLIGVPLVVIALPLTWLYLVRGLRGADATTRSTDRTQFRAELALLGPLSRAERTVVIITALVATCWIIKPVLDDWVPGLSDAGIAIAGAVLLFIVSAFGDDSEALTWDAVERLPWSVLILFGGGLSLADAVTSSQLAGWIGAAASQLATVPVVFVMLALSAIVLLLTELASNTATAAIFLPIVASVALGMGVNPFLLAVPVALAASGAFMMPVATPPNAIVFGSGRLTIGQMMRAGIWMNILMLFLSNALMFAIGSMVFPD